MIYTRISKFATRFLAIVFAIIFLSSSIVSAVPMSGEELNSLLRTSEWYDTKTLASCNNVANIDFSGSENAKIAFLYFIGRGLSLQQSAGLVGNLQAESSVEPDTQEANPIGGGRGGYGIAQWTGGRRTAIENFANATGNPAVLKDLKFQLDYLWDQELVKGYKQSVLDPLKLASSVQQSSDIVLVKFETPKVIVDNQPGPVAQLKKYRGGLGQKIYDLYASSSASIVPVSATGSGCSASGGGVAAGFAGFPLTTTKQSMSQLNGNCFSGGVMCKAGHPYAAYDILADVGTPVVSILGGKVITITSDKCPGRMVSIYNTEQDVTISYLHMSMAKTLVKDNQVVTPGQNIGFVGAKSEGCGTPHLHIDAATGQPRPGCKRESCPAANAALFQAGDAKIGLGKTLYDTYLKLP